MTRPLAGCWTSIPPSAVCWWMYGSRFARMTIFSPCRCRFRVCFRRSAVHCPGASSRSLAMRPDQLAHVAENGLKFPALLPSAAKQAAQFQAPVVARPFGHEHRHAKRHDGQDAKGNDQEGPRLGFPPFDVAQVVQQDREAQLLSLVRDGHHAHMHAAGGQGRDGAPLLEPAPQSSARIGCADPGPDRPTAEFLRESRGAGSRLQVGIAGRRAHHAFVAREVHQLLLKILGVPVPGIGERLPRADQHQLGA